MKRSTLFAAPLLFLSVGSAAPAQTIIDKQPDQGAYWIPIGNGGSYVYASDFLCPEGESSVAFLGSWLQPEGNGQRSVIAFQIWGGDAENGPDASDIIATTADFEATTGNFELYVHEVIEQSRDLEPGERYWFVITAAGRGEPTYAAYIAGGHSQNSAYQDNGTFWYSNDPNGLTFDGQRATPQMAFQVHLAPAVRLAISGDCPGMISACVSGNDPGDRVAVVYSIQKGAGPTVPGCPDLRVDLQQPTIAGVGEADLDGEFCVTGSVPAAGCGRVLVQGVNLTQCATTSVEGI